MFLIILLILGFISHQPILASDRNIFGLHLTQTSDINSAYSLINSTGGDWGYATIVIRTDQLDPNTWQNFFDNCRKLHIIPIIRLATKMENDVWTKPQPSDIDNLAEFLHSLNWPSSPQYIIIFNESNHASEWGGGVDPKNYADISIYTYQIFKQLDTNFYILGPALDLASPENMPEFKSADNFYRDIFAYRPDYFDNLDGLASHSYPNYGFIGKPSDTGQHSIRGYLWELEFIKKMGVSKILPVFITETGWPHLQGQTVDYRFFSLQTSASFLQSALEFWQSDPKVLAVTPFIYNYSNLPFDHFSWLDQNNKLYPEYQAIINIPKAKNKVIQQNNYQVEKFNLPFLIFSDQDYYGEIKLKNTGQSIWGETQFCLAPQTTPNVTLDAICTNNTFVYPGQIQTFNFKFKINSNIEFTDNTFISWEGLPPFEITPFSGTDKIYHPKTNFLSGLKNLFDKIFR